MANKKLTRSTNKMLAGVCGGIAEFFDIDPTLIRVCYAALSVFSAAFPGLILYIILMLIMQVKDKNDGFEEAEVVK
jgi:phage shock protein PspC (stress-responsive transcriptional regulator)